MSVLSCLLGLITLCIFSALASEKSARSALEILKLAEIHMKSTDYSITTHKCNTSRPFTTIAYAQTIDGSIAPLERSRLDLSSNTSFQLLHSLRGIHDAVLVGINTVAFDQPRLNVRNPLKASCFPKIQPRPVVIDTNLRIKHLQSMQLANPIVITCVSNETELFQECLAKLNSIGGDLVCCKVDSAGRCDIQDCLHILHDNFGIRSILVEGGAGIIQSFLELELVDQMVVTIRPCFLGGYRSMEKQLPKIFNLDCIQVASVEGDIVIYGVPVNFNESSSSKPLEPLLENLKATRSRIKFVGYG